VGNTDECSSNYKDTFWRQRLGPCNDIFAEVRAAPTAAAPTRPRR
jgi:hypothetical protein